MYTNIHNIYAHTHTSIHTHIRKYIYTYIHITYQGIHTHIHTHAHTYQNAQQYNDPGNPPPISLWLAPFNACIILLTLVAARILRRAQSWHGRSFSTLTCATLAIGSTAHPLLNVPISLSLSLSLSACVHVAIGSFGDVVLCRCVLGVLHCAGVFWGCCTVQVCFGGVALCRCVLGVLHCAGVFWGCCTVQVRFGGVALCRCDG